MSINVSIRRCKQNYKNLKYTGKYLLFEKFLQNTNFRNILDFTTPYVYVYYHDSVRSRMLSITSRFRMFRYISVRFGTFRYISVHFGIFRYISVHFGTFRYVSVRSSTIRQVSVQKYLLLIHSFGTYKYVSVHFRTYMYDTVRHRTFQQVHVRFGTIWYTEKNCLVNFTRCYNNSLTDCPHWHFFKNFLEKFVGFLKKFLCSLEKFIGFLEKFVGSLQKITIVHSKIFHMSSL